MPAHTVLSIVSDVTRVIDRIFRPPNFFTPDFFCFPKAPPNFFANPRIFLLKIRSKIFAASRRFYVNYDVFVSTNDHDICYYVLFSVITSSVL